MNLISNIWSKTSRIGIRSGSTDYSESKIVNRITLILFVFLMVIYLSLFIGSVVFNTHPLNINDLRIIFAALSCIVVLLFMRGRRVFIAKIILSFLPVFFLIAYPVLLDTVTSHMFFISSLIIVAYSTLPHFIFNYDKERFSYFTVIFFMFVMLIFSEYFLQLSNPDSIGLMYKKQWFFYIKLAEVLTFFYLNSILFSINKQNSKNRNSLHDKLNELYEVNKTINAQNKEIYATNTRLVDYQFELQNQNQQLIDRTNQLNQQKQSITRLYQELQNTYDQLIKAEKMATLGQLTSGIVKVIDNPISSAKVHLKSLQADINIIIDLLRKYAALDAENYEKAIQDLKQQRQSQEFDNLLKRIYSLPKSVADHIQEAIELIKELKSFSSLNHAEMIKYDLVTGLKSSINLIIRQYEEVLEVEQDFNRIPPVECFPGRMNQAFMNLLSSSANYLKSQNENNRKLFIKTHLQSEENMVKIIIAYRGDELTCQQNRSIAETFQQHHLHELNQIGISIAANIISEHQGTLEIQWFNGFCNFIIYLPVNQPGSGSQRLSTTIPS